MPLRHPAIALVLTATAAGLVPQTASAQAEIRVGPDTRFAGSTDSRNSTLSRILVDGTVLNAENVRSSPAVLFAVRLEKGRVVSRGESGTFRLDLRQASSSRGMPLGTAISWDQLRRLEPVARLAETIGKYYVPASKGVSASELSRQTGVSFTSLLGEAFSGGPGGGGYGGGAGAYGGGPTSANWLQTENLLLIAVVPASPEERTRYRARPLALVY